MKKKILIVEDNALNLKLLNDLLQAHGYETFEDNTGSRFVQQTRLNRPDLILMDIHLPHISGLDLIRVLRADSDLQHIPILAVTALVMGEEANMIRESGCDGYIAKPISISSFLSLVEKFSNQNR